MHPHPSLKSNRIESTEFSTENKKFNSNNQLVDCDLFKRKIHTREGGVNEKTLISRKFPIKKCTNLITISNELVYRIERINEPRIIELFLKPMTFFLRTNPELDGFLWASCVCVIFFFSFGSDLRALKNSEQEMINFKVKLMKKYCICEPEHLCLDVYRCSMLK